MILFVDCKNSSIWHFSILFFYYSTITYKMYIGLYDSIVYIYLIYKIRWFIYIFSKTEIRISECTFFLLHKARTIQRLEVHSFRLYRFLLFLQIFSADRSQYHNFANYYKLLKTPHKHIKFILYPNFLVLKWIH